MRPQKIAHVSDRGVISVAGPDAAKLLQGLITNDIAAFDGKIGAGWTEAIDAGLLSPQGKILFEFLIANAPGTFLLDVAHDRVSDLIKRLTMYKLRADVSISDVTANYKLLALWGPDSCSSGETIGTVSFIDPRSPGLGRRIWAEARFATDIASATNGFRVSEQDYHAHRIALGIPEGGKDYDFGDAYPHEADFDLFNGVSFTKGCYVGQEVVSRMQNKSVIRKRVVKVTGATPLTNSSDVVLGNVAIGRIGSTAGVHALAMLRLDRMVEAIEKGIPLSAGGISLIVDPEALSHYRSSVTAHAAKPGFA